MITYNRSAFGLALIFRVHGSAFYRSVFPSLVAVAIYFLFWSFQIEEEEGVAAEHVGHPYALGVVVTSSTFLIVFKLNQSYNRYWEACGNVHQFMSKWMDATTHTSVYHMQCDHYESIKPPSFYEYPELNSLFMTRDRERMNTYSVQGDRDESGKESESELRSRKKTQPERSQRHIPNVPPPQRFASGNNESSGQKSDSRGEYRRSSSSSSGEQARRIYKNEIKEEYKRRAIAKSINYLDGPRYKQQTTRRDKWQNSGKTRSISSLQSVISKSVRDVNMANLESSKIYGESIFHSFGSEPIPLVGKPRMDGNWGAYYTKNPKHPLSTFVDPNDVDKADPKGFASVQGERTPPLFLQELAHLSSLLNAVALSTLRNDVEGCESPLAIYEPGQPWPEVDPNKDELVKKEGFKAFVEMAKNFLGVGLTAEQRSKYNAAQPLPVIGGVSDAEIRFLQIARGPYAKTQLCFNWLTEFIIREHLSGSLGDVAPPIISRIAQFLGDGMIFYNHARKIMFIPFPFGHAQISVVFVLFMCVVIPFLMQQYTDEPAVGAILTFLTVLCLEGINEVARDLENPFRNFPNELPLVNFQAQYNEALLTMYAGYHPDLFWDGDQVMHMAHLSATGASRSNQENGGRGFHNTASSDQLFNGTPMNAKPQNASDFGPLDNGGGDTSEVAALKLQLESQAKLIEELFAKVGNISEKG